MEAEFAGIRDMLQKLILNIAAGEKSRLPDSLPTRITARVLSIRGTTAILRGEGSVFQARLDAPADSGETLRLEYIGIKDGRYYYRIIERCGPADRQSKPVSEADKPFLCCLPSPLAEQSDSKPVLLRFFKHREGKKHNSAVAGDAIHLELYVETENLGLVLITIAGNSSHLRCQFFVEKEEVGGILEREARQMLGEDLTVGGRGSLLSWTVADLDAKIASTLQTAEPGIDARV